MKRDLLTLLDLNRAEILRIIEESTRLKDLQKRGIPHPMLLGKSVAMVFEKPSTRTRVSFEVGIAQLGANPIVLHAGEMQLGRGETVEDTARDTSWRIAVSISSGDFSESETVALTRLARIS